MKYMLLIHEDQAQYEDAKVLQEIVQAHTAFAQALTEGGVLRGGEGLHPPGAATTLRKASGRYVVHDGPFAETKEQLGGFYLIEVDGIEAAKEWARKLPLVSDGSIEIRPVIDFS